MVKYELTEARTSYSELTNDLELYKKIISVRFIGLRTILFGINKALHFNGRCSDLHSLYFVYDPCLITMLEVKL